MQANAWVMILEKTQYVDWLSHFGDTGPKFMSNGRELIFCSRFACRRWKIWSRLGEIISGGV